MKFRNRNMTYKKIFRNRFYDIYDIPRRWNIFLLNGVAASVFTPPILRKMIYKSKGWKIGKNSKIFPKCISGSKCKLVLGNNSYVNWQAFLDLNDSITIGNNCSIAMRCNFVTTFHDIGSHECRGGESRTAPIFVGNGCWIGAHCTILPGVIIADGCVIGANSLVTKDTEPDGLYVGSPAKRIRTLD